MRTKWLVQICEQKELVDLRFMPDVEKVMQSQVHGIKHLTGNCCIPASELNGMYQSDESGTSAQL